MRGLLSSLLGRGHRPETLYPRSQEDVVQVTRQHDGRDVPDLTSILFRQVLRQAKDNSTGVRVSGGSYPFTALPHEVVVDLRYMDRLVGLDVYQQT